MIQNILIILQIVIAVLLVVVILIQQKGVGLGAAFGGGNTIYTTKRGVDKVLYKATIVLSILFFAVAIAQLVV